MKWNRHLPGGADPSWPSFYSVAVQEVWQPFCSNILAVELLALFWLGSARFQCLLTEVQQHFKTSHYSGNGSWPQLFHVICLVDIAHTFTAANDGPDLNLHISQKSTSIRSSMLFPSLNMEDTLKRFALCYWESLLFIVLHDSAGPVSDYTGG